MTIIEPNRNKLKINFILPMMILVLILGILFNVYLYNYTVGLKYQLNAALKSLQQLEVANADFKNELYGSLETDKLTQLVEKFGLIKESRPEYLENPWVVATHY